MKKTLLAATTLSALMASGMANAAFIDADGSGGWTGNLEFNGTITSTSPDWKYQIPEATIAGAKNWDVKRLDGTVDGSNTNFSFAKNLTVLEGVMKAPAPTGGAGLQPLVTFSSPEDGGYIWDTTTTDLYTPKTITVSAKKESTTVGKLTFNLSGQIATQAMSKVNFLAISEDVYSQSPDALALLKAQPYYASTYLKFGNKWDGGLSTTLLANRGLAKLSSSIVAQASEFKLSVPTESIPDAWSATLPISITVK